MIFHLFAKKVSSKVFFSGSIWPATPPYFMTIVGRRFQLLHCKFDCVNAANKIGCPDAKVKLICFLDVSFSHIFRLVWQFIICFDQKVRLTNSWFWIAVICIFSLRLCANKLSFMFIRLPHTIYMEAVIFIQPKFNINVRTVNYAHSAPFDQYFSFQIFLMANQWLSREVSV